MYRVKVWVHADNKTGKRKLTSELEISGNIAEAVQEAGKILEASEEAIREVRIVKQ